MFEYKVVHNYIDSLEIVLNYYSKDGWKLDQVIFLPRYNQLRHLPFIESAQHPVYIVLVREAQHVNPT